jgi:hypothetical protein
MSSVTIFGVLKSLSALMRMGYSSMSGSELEKIHSKRVEKIKKYTPNELRRSKTTLETGGELTVSMFQPGVTKGIKTYKLTGERPRDDKTYTQKYTRFELRRCKTTLETSVEDAKLHSKRVEKM